MIDVRQVVRETIIDIDNRIGHLYDHPIMVTYAELYPVTDNVAMSKYYTPEKDDLLSAVVSFPNDNSKQLIVIDYGFEDYLSNIGKDFIQNVVSHEFSHLIIKAPATAEEKTVLFDEGFISRKELFFMGNNILPRVRGEVPWFASRIRKGELNIRSLSKKELILKIPTESGVDELFAVTFGNNYSNMRAIERYRLNRNVKPHVNDFYKERNITEDPVTEIIVE